MIPRFTASSFSCSSVSEGTFRPLSAITVYEEQGQLTMQEALPTFVLNSETLPREPMNDTLATPANPSPQAEPEGPGMSDERLVLAFTQGSSEAFTELFHRYKQSVYGFFCRRIADPANAEELARETFFALLRARDHYEPRALFRTYLYAISFKILRAHRRKAAFRATFFGHRKPVWDLSKRDATESGLWVRRGSLLVLVLFLAEFVPSLVFWLVFAGIPAWSLSRRYRRAQSRSALAGA